MDSSWDLTPELMLLTTVLHWPIVTTPYWQLQTGTRCSSDEKVEGTLVLIALDRHVVLFTIKSSATLFFSCFLAHFFLSPHRYSLFSLSFLYMINKSHSQLLDMLWPFWERIWAFVSPDTYKLEENIEPSSQSHGPSVWWRERPIQNELSGWEDTCFLTNSCRET